MNRKGFTIIEALIIVAIVAIIAAITIPAFVGGVSKPRQYEGWTYVTDAPRNHHIYMKYVPEKHVTIWWDDYHGTFTVVKEDR